jgi:Zn-finger nucleic acid-binding protein
MSADVTSLHCPNCGAAVQTDAARCPYCRARLAAVSCPSCFSPMFAGAKYCEKCGAERARLERDDTAARCPACSNHLQEVTVGSTTMFECGSCDGMWVDADAFERLCADKASQAAVLHHVGRSGSAHTVQPVKYRPCLSCGKMMNRVNFGKLSGAVVDVCKGHGTFMDAGELHQIVAFIQDGGLERARARQIEEAREEQQKLEALQRMASLSRDRHGTTSKTSAGESLLDAGLLSDLIDLIRGR